MDSLFDDIFGENKEKPQDIYNELFDILAENQVNKYIKKYSIYDTSKTCQILPSWRNEYDEIFKHY